MSLTLKRLIFLFSALLIAFLLFVFRGTIFSGKIIIKADPPYTINIINEPLIFCENPICEIKTSPGLYPLIIQKAGYQSQLVQTDVKLWGTQQISVDLRLTPKAQIIESIPNQTIYTYTLPINRQTGSQTLQDSNNQIIAVFPKSLKNPYIVSNTNFVLILTDNDAYLVDVLRQNRQKLTLPSIERNNLQLSPLGNYLAFQNSQKVQLLDLHSFDIIDTGFDADNSLYLWGKNDKLYLSTSQTFQEGDEQSSPDSIDIQQESDDYILFATYDPLTKSTKKVLEFHESTLLPNVFQIDQKGQKLYFQVQDQAYEINL